MECISSDLFYGFFWNLQFSRPKSHFSFASPRNDRRRKEKTKKNVTWPMSRVSTYTRRGISRECEHEKCSAHFFNNLHFDSFRDRKINRAKFFMLFCGFVFNWKESSRLWAEIAWAKVKAFVEWLNRRSHPLGKDQKFMQWSIQFMHLPILWCQQYFKISRVNYFLDRYHQVERQRSRDPSKCNDSRLPMNSKTA